LTAQVQAEPRMKIMPLVSNYECVPLLCVKQKSGTFYYISHALKHLTKISEWSQLTLHFRIVLTHICTMKEAIYPHTNLNN